VPKHAVSLAAQVTGAVRRHAGLEVHPHLFRHFAAKLSLQEAPGNYEQARRLLGHRSIDTTTLYYTGLDTARAAAVYQEQLLERHARLRGRAGGVAGGPGGGRARG
jgi:integrase